MRGLTSVLETYRSISCSRNHACSTSMNGYFVEIYFDGRSLAAHAVDMKHLEYLFSAVRSGELSVEAALQQWSATHETDLGFAKADVGRARRCGQREVIYAAGKTPEQVSALFEALGAETTPVMATRASETHYAAVKKHFPSANFDPVARIITLATEAPKLEGKVAVVAAGTSDLPVAKEAAVTAAFMGARVEEYIDVGVAGLHRLVNRIDAIRSARVVIAVAGMEGALPSVLGGLIDRPLIAVPTSVGYGMNLNGLAALLAMLNSCAAGITVVNVDNGFGAGVAAALINRSPSEEI